MGVFREYFHLPLTLDEKENMLDFLGRRDSV